MVKKSAHDWSSKLNDNENQLIFQNVEKSKGIVRNTFFKLLEI